MLGVHSFKIVFSDLELSVKDKKDVYYEATGNHTGRENKEFDLQICRYENGIFTHVVALYLGIANPVYIFDKLNSFRSKPSYYFFSITNLFTRADFNDSDIIKYFPNGVPIVDMRTTDVTYVRF